MQHGLKRTNADKRRAVKMLLDDDEWGQNSATWISEKCDVEPSFVLEEKGKHPKFQVLSDKTSKVRGKDGKMYPAKKAARATAPTPPQSQNGADSISLQNKNSDEKAAHFRVRRFWFELLLCLRLHSHSSGFQRVTIRQYLQTLAGLENLVIIGMQLDPCVP
jgi:hypothetical protein